MIYVDRDPILKIVIVVIPLDFAGEVSLFYAFCCFRGVDFVNAVLNFLGITVVICETRNIQCKKEMFRWVATLLQAIKPPHRGPARIPMMSAKP